MILAVLVAHPCFGCTTVLALEKIEPTLLFPFLLSPLVPLPLPLKTPHHNLNELTAGVDLAALAETLPQNTAPATAPGDSSGSSINHPPRNHHHHPCSGSSLDATAVPPMSAPSPTVAGSGSGNTSSNISGIEAAVEQRSAEPDPGAISGRSSSRVAGSAVKAKAGGVSHAREGDIGVVHGGDDGKGETGWMQPANNSNITQKRMKGRGGALLKGRGGAFLKNKIQSQNQKQRSDKSPPSQPATSPLSRLSSPSLSSPPGKNQSRIEAAAVRVATASENNAAEEVIARRLEIALAKACAEAGMGMGIKNDQGKGNKGKGFGKRPAGSSAAGRGKRPATGRGKVPGRKPSGGGRGVGGGSGRSGCGVSEEDVRAGLDGGWCFRLNSIL